MAHMYAPVDVETAPTVTEQPRALSKKISAAAFTFLLVVACVMVFSAHHESTSTTAPHESTSTTAPHTAMFSAATEMPEAASDWNCTNVMDWNFFDGKITQNNLGGKGPNFQDKQEIRYSGVYQKGDIAADMVVTVDTSYAPYTLNNNLNNGLLGQFGQINILTNSKAKLKFQLVQSGTETPISVSADEKILFSVYDLDSAGVKTGIPNGHEYVQFTSGVASHSVTTPTTVAVTGNNEDGTLYAESTRPGSASDNPTDPLRMTEIAEESKISVVLVGRSSWEFVFGSKEAVEKRPSGRNVLFAGRSQGDCACVGVSDWNLDGNLQHNNLGGKGPVSADPPELRYSKVFEAGWEKQAVDLVITVADSSTYNPANTALNGLWPQPTPDHSQMAQVNIRCATETTFDFAFVKSGTDTVYDLSNTFFSVYDIDQKARIVNHEYVVFATPPTAWKLSENTEVLQSGSTADGTLQFTSTTAGVLSDNPTNPRELTSLQQSRSVTVWYSSSSTFQVTLGATCTNPEGGRNFLFAGPGIYCRKQGEVEPTELSSSLTRRRRRRRRRL